MPGFFVTGTDTGCGKTRISLGLMQLLQDRGQTVSGMKPVASGARMTPAGLRNEDALRLQAQGSIDLPYPAINPYAFKPPIAPHLAARQAETVIDLGLIRQRYHALAARVDAVVVEGIGGWRVPLNDSEAVSDLARMLDLPVILVVGLKLGCINHALLSTESILAGGALLAGWVANGMEPEMPAGDGNIETIREAVPAPCLGVVPYLETPTAGAVAGSLQLPK